MTRQSIFRRRQRNQTVNLQRSTRQRIHVCRSNESCTTLESCFQQPVFQFGKTSQIMQRLSSHRCSTRVSCSASRPIALSLHVIIDSTSKCGLPSPRQDLAMARPVSFFVHLDNNELCLQPKSKDTLHRSSPKESLPLIYSLLLLSPLLTLIHLRLHAPSLPQHAHYFIPDGGRSL